MVHGLYGTFFPWKCPNQIWEGFTVYTNNMIGGGYRGYGAPQGCFAVESQIDEICDKLDWDPIEFRLKKHIGMMLQELEHKAVVYKSFQIQLVHNVKVPKTGPAFIHNFGLPLWIQIAGNLPDNANNLSLPGCQ